MPKDDCVCVLYVSLCVRICRSGIDFHGTYSLNDDIFQMRRFADFVMVGETWSKQRTERRVIYRATFLGKHG